MKFIDIIYESEEERLLKKAHTIYKALKTGVLNRGQWGVVKYRLPDHYKVDLDHSNDIFIKVGGKGEDNRVIFYIEDDMENTELSHIFVNIINHLKNRYRHFNIKLDLNPYSNMVN